MKKINVAFPFLLVILSTGCTTEFWKQSVYNSGAKYQCNQANSRNPDPVSITSDCRFGENKVLTYEEYESERLKSTEGDQFIKAKESEI